MESLLWSLFDRFVLFLASLNPSTKAKVDKLSAEAAALEAERKQLLQDIEDGEKINNQLNTIRTANAIERKKLEEAIKQSEADLAAKNAAVLARPDDDIERPLPL